MMIMDSPCESVNKLSTKCFPLLVASVISLHSNSVNAGRKAGKGGREQREVLGRVVGKGTSENLYKFRKLCNSQESSSSSSRGNGPVVEVCLESLKSRETRKEQEKKG